MHGYTANIHYIAGGRDISYTGIVDFTTGFRLVRNLMAGRPQ